MQCAVCIHGGRPACRPCRPAGGRRGSGSGQSRYCTRQAYESYYHTPSRVIYVLLVLFINTAYWFEHRS